MKHLKLFEDYKGIKAICQKYDIENYTINSDGSINVDGFVNLRDCNLHKLPLRFEKVTGNFYCSDNKLSSLEGAPRHIDGDFICENNKLKSLEGSPKYVGGGFNCRGNELKSLEGCPHYIGGFFDCSVNFLTTLDVCPKYIGGNFILNINSLKSINGCPNNISMLYCIYNPIDKWWSKIKNTKYLEIFMDMNIHSDDPDEINQEKIDIILGK